MRRFPFVTLDVFTRRPLEGNQLAAFVAGTWANGDYLAFLRLFLRDVGNDDPAFGFRIAFRAPDDDAVMKWPEFHWGLSAAAHRAATSPT